MAWHAVDAIVRVRDGSIEFDAVSNVREGDVLSLSPNRGQKHIYTHGLDWSKEGERFEDGQAPPEEQRETEDAIAESADTDGTFLPVLRFPLHCVFAHPTFLIRESLGGSWCFWIIIVHHRAQRAVSWSGRASFGSVVVRELCNADWTGGHKPGPPGPRRATRAAAPTQ